MTKSQELRELRIEGITEAEYQKIKETTKRLSDVLINYETKLNNAPEELEAVEEIVEFYNIQIELQKDNERLSNHLIEVKEQFEKRIEQYKTFIASFTEKETLDYINKVRTYLEYLNTFATYTDEAIIFDPNIKLLIETIDMFDLNGEQARKNAAQNK